MLRVNGRKYDERGKKEERAILANLCRFDGLCDGSSSSSSSGCVVLLFSFCRRFKVTCLSSCHSSHTGRAAWLPTTAVLTNTHAANIYVFENLFFLLATVRDAVCSRITHSRHVRHSEIHFYSDFEARVCVCVSFDLIHTHLIECWHRISIAFLWKFNSCQNIPFTSMTAVHLAMCKPANSPNSLHLNSIQI